MWDVKHKQWNRKHFKASVGLAEFNLGSFGLGFQFHHTSRATMRLYDHFAHLFVQIGWIEVWGTLEWGRKPEMDAVMRRARQRWIAQSVRK